MLMQVGKLLLAAPAVVLENEIYDLLVGTQLLREYNGIINLKDGYLSILGYKVPLIFEEPVKVPGLCLKTCALEYPTGVFTLKYRTHSSNFVADPEWIRRKVVHLGIKQWNNHAIALLHPYLLMIKTFKRPLKQVFNLPFK
ncbi:hypothetical protein DSO57_1036405 [Entomophthora muscae]|nr:hypothetical protein DSO57_1036405 [Entomophthora muscae]